MYTFRALRWRYLLLPLKATRFAETFRATVLGFAASVILPARAGEVIRPYLLARREQIPTSAVFATIVLERVLDLIALLMLLAMYLVAQNGSEAASAPRLHKAIFVGGALMVPFGLALLFFMFVMAGHRQRLHRFTIRLEGLLPHTVFSRKLSLLIIRFADGLGVVRHARRLAICMVWSVLLWLAIAAQLWVIMTAFGISLPLRASFLLTAMLLVGVSVPTPGGVGGVHEVLRLGLTSFYSVDNDVAIGAATVHHALNFVVLIAVAVTLMMRDGLTTSSLRTLTNEAAPAGTSVDVKGTEVTHQKLQGQ